MAVSERSISEPIFVPRRGAGGGFSGAMRGLWKFARHYPLGAISGVLCFVLLLIAILSWQNTIVPYNPDKVYGSDRLLGFMSTSGDGERFYILGTDNLGRDMLSRLLKGAQLSIFFGVGVAIVSTLAGGVVGLLSSYAGGKVDLFVQRLVDAVQTIPFLVLAIAVVSILGPGVWQAFWVVAILSVTRPARVIRGSVFSAKENVWVEAARCIGCTDRRIMFRHILPNVIAPMIVLVSYLIGVGILIEASLSFLGLGVPPPTSSWGSMLSGNGAAYFTTNPRLALLPGIAISVIIFATNMFGDAIRDALDPRLRGSR